MRFRTLSLIGAPAVATVPLAANAASSPAVNQPIAQQSAQTEESCPPGSWWTPAGYAEHGKWRPGHCAPDAAG
jgi:hypothetical protein